jgi:hypothetical protein
MSVLQALIPAPKHAVRGKAVFLGKRVERVLCSYAWCDVLKGVLLGANYVVVLIDVARECLLRVAEALGVRILRVHRNAFPMLLL